MTLNKLHSNQLPYDFEREAQREVFIGSQATFLEALPSDASKRRYFRYPGGLLMDAPPPENPTQFVHIATYLKNIGFSAPTIFDQDLQNGFLSIEDFGQETYTYLLQAGEDPYPLYNLAIDTLIALHRRATRPDFIKQYDLEALLKEVEIFVDWYLPASLGKTLSALDKQTYFNLWSDAFTKAFITPQSLVLRDYHVDNLMRLKGRIDIQACGLLDFQEAVWGPVVYDLISLIEDARLDIDSALAEHCWQRYLSAFPEEDELSLRMAGCILSAGRHVKIIGIFTRLAVRDNKPKYLSHLPRVWKLLEKCLLNSHLHPIKMWFEEHLNISHSHPALKENLVKI